MSRLAGHTGSATDLGPMHATDLRSVLDALLYNSQPGRQRRFLSEAFGTWFVVLISFSFAVTSFIAWGGSVPSPSCLA
jgi:hypothetical protein